MQQWLQSLRVLVVYSVLCGLIYPLSVTLPGGLFFAEESRGSLLKKGNAVGGSLLLARPGKEGRFWPRPSAVDYATVPSGASNKGIHSSDLKAAVQKRRLAWEAAHGTDAPDEMLFASASGLDPHISPENALSQTERISRETNIQPEQISRLILDHTEEPLLGIFGRKRVNVQILNQALDELDARQ
ncbi:MAG: potassium-transporting ATPase subunit C [Spirochaetales bacterium]|nr:potassium-transporting ATPase subunit C [Spirochaetales bacterium]